jgi:hypothetical protein
MKGRLQGEVLKRGIEFRRTIVTSIQEVFEAFPDAKAVFNCTGLGSYHLKGVEDQLLYPTRVCDLLNATGRLLLTGS